MGVKRALLIRPNVSDKRQIGSDRWAETQGYIEAGRLPPPTCLTPPMADRFNLTPRFATNVQRGDGPQKVRIIDDICASGVIAFASMLDTTAPESLGRILALAVYCRFLSPGFVLRAASANFAHPYKTSGLASGGGSRWRCLGRLIGRFSCQI